MKEQTKSKKRWLFYLVLAVGVLLLAAATVLTVYFLTKGGDQILVEEPPVIADPDPIVPDAPPEEPSEPSSGQTVRFVSPVENASPKVNFYDVYDNKTLGWGYYHKAIDYDAAEGSTVRCIGDGVVESVTYSEFTGNLVVIDHGDGLRSYYRFVEPVDGLGKGEKVTRGEAIGTVAGAYGIERFDGVHLHFYMSLGTKPVNPTDYLDVLLEEK